MSINNIELLLEGIGYQRIGLHEYSFEGANISRIAIVLPILKERIFQLKLSSMSNEEKAKEIEIHVLSTLIKKRKQEMLKQESLKRSMTEEISSKVKLDRIEKAEDNANRPYAKGRDLQFGARATTYKDIGIDLCKQKKGG